MDRSRDSSAAVHERIAGERIHRHDRRIAEQSAELQLVSCLLADRGNDADCRCLLVDHTDCHLIGDQPGNRRRLRISRNCNHIQPDGAYTGHCLQLLQRQRARLYRIDHSLILADRNERAA